MKIRVIANSAGIFAKVILALQTVKHFCNTSIIMSDTLKSVYYV
jgi:hypothetical protein